MGIQQDIANADLIGQQHHQAVDAAAEPAVRRHPIAHGVEIIFVQRRGLIGFVRVQSLHFHEAILLVARVIQLGEGVAHLHTGDEKLETLGVALDIAALLVVFDFGVAVDALGEGRHIARVVLDDGGLRQLGFDKVAQQMLDNHPSPGIGRAEPVGQPTPV